MVSPGGGGNSNWIKRVIGDYILIGHALLAPRRLHSRKAPASQLRPMCDASNVMERLLPVSLGCPPQSSSQLYAKMITKNTIRMQPSEKRISLMHGLADRPARHQL